MIREGDPNYKRVDEYEFIDLRTGKKVYRCIGCYDEITFEEFKKEKGYCSKCRDGKNDPIYRSRTGG